MEEEKKDIYMKYRLERLKCKDIYVKYTDHNYVFKSKHVSLTIKANGNHLKYSFKFPSLLTNIIEDFGYDDYGYEVKLYVRINHEGSVYFFTQKEIEKMEENIE